MNSKKIFLSSCLSVITFFAFSNFASACMWGHKAKKNEAPTVENSLNVRNAPIAEQTAKVSDSMDPHANHNHQAQAQTNANTYSPALFDQINHKMHEGMNVTYTNQVDADFLKGMIPHHEGAVEMAKVVLAHSKNQKVRKLAQDIIDAQNKEIEMMKAWLAEKP